LSAVSAPEDCKESVVVDRIKGLDSGAIGSSSSGSPVDQIRASTPVSTGTSAPQPGVDSVNITDTARRLLSLAQAVQSTPEVDVQRVADLQQSISNGQYAVHPGRIADRMLQMDQELAAAH
jgi:negative regulator of flagellin synthesis FlgM